MGGLDFRDEVDDNTQAHDKPGVLGPNILAAIANLARENVIDGPTANQLEKTYQLYQQLIQILKLGVTGTFNPQTAPPGLVKLITVATASPDLATSEELLREAQSSIRDIFKRVIVTQ